MNTNDAPLATFTAGWWHSPWGMATVGMDGNVHAVNPAFERCTGLAGQTVLAMSEATLSTWLNAHGCEHRRVDILNSEPRAIYYLHDNTEGKTNVRRLSYVAELLREPLASIYGFAELLLTQNYDEETRQDLTATLLGEIEAMSNIINEQLDVTRTI
ncbi:Histidine kinase A domain protein [Gammaproteobacteria bacterium]